MYGAGDIKRELVVLPAALKFGILGMIGGALLGEIVRHKTRTVTLGLLLGLLLALMQTDAHQVSRKG